MVALNTASLLAEGVTTADGAKIPLRSIGMVIFNSHNTLTSPLRASMHFFAFFVVLTALAICGVVADAGASRDKAPPRADRQVLPHGVDAQLLSSSEARSRVTIFLADDSILEKLPKNAGTIGADLPGAAAARAAAVRSPNKATAQEKRIGATMDDQRNAVLLGELREAAKTGTRQNERVATRLEELGADVVSATPLPNTITAVVATGDVRAIAAWPEVTAVAKARAAHQMSSPIDGSETWHAAGFTGGGTSADGKGGPDYVGFDTGTRTTHQAFRTRLPSDCATCVGSGPSRVISPAGRTTFTGSKHGNVVAATVASTDLRSFSLASPWPPTWQLQKGLAYGLDKLYDPYEANDGYHWYLGLTYMGEPGVSDIPEVMNFSAGIYDDDLDLDPNLVFYDSSTDQLGITNTVAAGNCGLADPGYTGCGDGPHRVGAPATNFNVLSVGGVDPVQPYDQSTWTPWANSSPGPTWGGRKKPDLLATVTGVSPSAIDDSSYVNAGQGTSYAAPQAAAGAILLSSVGVYSPTAQRAILINSATPIQGQTYWTPTGGWGALNLDGAFTQRGYYANGSVSAAGANGTRFFRQMGVTAGDRTTLTWNRRTVNSVIDGSTYLALTNLDLIQVDASSGATTATGGSDAADTVDTNPTISAANPMPGNGTDGGDNVEQVRSTASGTEIYKVKALSAVDGAAAEPFSIAGSRPVQALQTPTPTVTLSPASPTIGVNGQTTVTGTVHNPSADLGLTGASVSLTLPAGTSLVSGSLTQAIGSIAANGTAVVNWQVKGNTAGSKSLSAAASGVTYGETFSGSGSTTLEVDGSAPSVSIGALPTWSTSTSVPLGWSATDPSGIATYDVETSVDGVNFTPLLSGTTSTSATASAGEGQTLTARVRATDGLGNTSGWTLASTTIDAAPPAIAIGVANTSVRGRVTVPVSVSNLGAPIVSATYTFGGGAAKPLPAGGVSYMNLGATPMNATLTVKASDALGRAVSAAATYTISSRFKSAALSVKTPKIKSRVAAITGSVASGVKGRATVTVTRTGKAGTKRVSKKVSIKKRKFSVKIPLKAGKYKVKVSLPQSGEFAAASSSKSFRVK